MTQLYLSGGVHFPGFLRVHNLSLNHLRLILVEKGFHWLPTSSPICHCRGWLIRLPSAMPLCKHKLWPSLKKEAYKRNLGMPRQEGLTNDWHTDTWTTCLICVYRSVPHIGPPFCNLSTSRKCRGGLYVGSDILSCECAPFSRATPRCWHRNIILQTVTEAGSTLICLRFSCPPETQWSRSTDRGWPQRRWRRFPNTL